jgi:prolyl 4-hydroxylase
MQLRLSPYVVLLALIVSFVTSEGTQTPLSSDYTCHDPPYKVHIVSKSPLVIYIANFLTKEERVHLQAITYITPHPISSVLFHHTRLTPSSKDTFTTSDITGTTAYNNAIRTSQSTSLPRDPVVRCIESRALLLQGLDLATHLEPIQLVRYQPGGHFHHHTDWFPDPVHSTAEQGGNRACSFFAYVHVAPDTVGGGTNFPLLDAPRDGFWCDRGYIDCDAPWEEGLTFRPVEGNAVLWVNLLESGEGDLRTMHAGLPVLGGGKVGMNIWTREGAVSDEVRRAWGVD